MNNLHQIKCDRCYQDRKYSIFTNIITDLFVANPRTNRPPFSSNLCVFICTITIQKIPIISYQGHLIPIACIIFSTLCLCLEPLIVKNLIVWVAQMHANMLFCTNRPHKYSIMVVKKFYPHPALILCKQPCLSHRISIAIQISDWFDYTIDLFLPQIVYHKTLQCLL